MSHRIRLGEYTGGAVQLFLSACPVYGSMSVFISAFPLTHRETTRYRKTELKFLIALMIRLW